MKDSRPVVVVGSYVQDLAFSTQNFPRPGETVIGDFQTGPGGKGSNQAVASQRAGVATTFIGAIGKDAFGAVARSFHQQTGIDSRWREVADACSGAASIVVNGQGQNQIVVALGACNHLGKSGVEERFPDHPQVVVTQLETDLGASLAAMKLGKDAGALTVLNPAPMRTDFDPGILEFVDVLIPNESEWLQLLEKVAPGLLESNELHDPSHADHKLLHELSRHLHVPTVILTLGSSGALLSTAEGYQHFPVLKDVIVVDTTGAGDAFVGGFAAGWVLHAGNLRAAILYGTVVAGLSVTQVGTAPAMPMLDAINRAIDDRGLQHCFRV